MSTYLDWIGAILLVIAVVPVALGYYEIEARKHRTAKPEIAIGDSRREK